MELKESLISYLRKKIEMQHGRLVATKNKVPNYVAMLPYMTFNLLVATPKMLQNAATYAGIDVLEERNIMVYVIDSQFRVDEFIDFALLNAKFFRNTVLEKMRDAVQKLEKQLAMLGRPSEKSIVLKGKRPVNKIIIGTSKVLAIYKSVSDAARSNGLRAHKIKECCEGKRMSYSGFYWRYADEQLNEFYHKKINKYRPVIAINPITGTVERYFTNMSDAERKGYKKSGVSASINGKKMLYLGYKWEYLDDKNVDAAIQYIKSQEVNKALSAESCT